MTSSNILFIGMDVHKESIEIAIADEANQEVRRYGKNRRNAGRYVQDR